MTHNDEMPISYRQRVLGAGVMAMLCVMSVACSGSPQINEITYLRRGEGFLAKKDYARALLEFKNASRVMPNDAEPYYQAGVTYVAQGSLANGAASLRKATELNPKHEQAKLKLGELMAASGRKEVVQQAASQLEAILSASPDNSEANDALAAAEWRLGKTEEAVARLEGVLQKFPSRLQTSVELARLKLRQKDLAGAEEVLKQAVSSAPQSSPAELALGQIYMLTNEPTKAEVELRKAIALDSKNGFALMGLAAVQAAGNRMAEADETYRLVAALPGAEFKPQHALFLYNSGKQGAALAEFEKLANEEPNDRGARSRLFTAYVAMGKNQAAENLVAVALKKNPNEIDALFERAGIWLRSGNPAEAEKDLRQVLRFAPDLAEAHAAMAEAYKATGLALAERQELTEALRIKSTLLQSRLALARSFTRGKEAKAALDILNKTPPSQKGTLAFVIERNWALLGAGETKELRSALDQALRIRRAPELVIQDAVARLQQADYSGVIADAEEAIRDDPSDTRGPQLLTDAYVAQQHPAKAEERLKAIVAAHPQSAPLANLLGRLYLRQRSRPEARKAFEAALAADPKSVEASLALAGIDSQEKHSDAARQRLLILVAANPKNVSALLMLGNVAGDMGDPEEALRRYRAAVAFDGSSVPALNNLAYTLAASQPDEALKYAQQAAELAPDNAMVDDTLGWVYYNKAAYETAVSYLETAVAEQPTPRRQFHLAMSYLKSGQRERGEKILQLALRQDPSLPGTEKGW